MEETAIYLIKYILNAEAPTYLRIAALLALLYVLRNQRRTRKLLQQIVDARQYEDSLRSKQKRKKAKLPEKEEENV